MTLHITNVQLRTDRLKMVRRLMLGACAASLLLTGCEKKNSDNSNAASATTTAKDVATKAQDTMGAAADYASEQKDEIMAKLQEQYAELKPKLEQLKAKAQNAGADASAQLTKTMNELEIKRAAFEAELKKLKDSSGDAWKSISEGANSAWTDLKGSFEQASKELTADKAK